MFVSLTLILFSQTLTVTSSATRLFPGQTATLTYVLAGQTNPNISALQFDQAVLTSLTVSNKVVAGTAASAGKSLTCSQAGNRCILVSIGSSVIANGTVLTATLTVPVGTAPGSFNIALSNLFAASNTAQLVPVVSGPLLTITVAPALTDLNGDGQTTLLDINLIVAQVLAGTCPVGYDQDSNSVCDIRDVQIVAAAAH